jgi:hypothetical protein
VLANRKAKWGGCYTSNDWQRVADVDAWALAAALYRAIAAIERGLELTPDQKEALTRMEPQDIDDNFRPVDPASVTGIADFVSKGEFEIG